MVKEQNLYAAPREFIAHQIIILTIKVQQLFITEASYNKGNAYNPNQFLLKIAHDTTRSVDPNICSLSRKLNPHPSDHS